MKKSLFSIIGLVLVIGLTLLLMSSVFANNGKWVNAQREPLYPVDFRSSNFVRVDLPSQGEVNFVDPMGNVTLIIQGNVGGLLANHCYEVWIRDLDPGYDGTFIKKYAPLGYYMLETFITNDEGKGKFHLNIRSDDLSSGVYHIQLAINCCEVGGTVLATEKWIEVTIKE